MKLPLSTRIARRTLAALPAPRYAVSYEPHLPVPMADGVELLADHYYPEPATPQDFPTLLVRSPYGRGFPWAALYGVAFAEQGFHVLLQSSRGTAGSGGVFQLWRDDGPDGQATIAWLRRQAWFDGRLGLVGPSAMAYAQWALAAEPPPELKAMVVHVPLHNPHGFFHRNGVFALEDALIAVTAVATQHLGVRRFLGATLRLARGMKRIVRSESPIETYGQVMGRSPTSLTGAAAHPDPGDGYWQGTDLLSAADGLEVPTLVVSGWSDVALDQALQQYGRLPAGYRSLLIGPWTHTTAFQRGVGKIFGESAAWLRGHLVDPAPPKERIQVALGGTDEWRDLAAWPPAAVPVPWYPHPEGGLMREPPGTNVAAGTVHYNPADPTPSVGGSGLTQKSGIRDNTALEQRNDVLIFTSTPLTAAIEVIGTVAAEILVDPGIGSSSATLFVRLCDVDERGHSWNVCDGITRVVSTDSSSQPAAVTVAMSSTAHRFLPGHRIRIQISGGAHPRFAAAREAFRLEIRPGSAIVLPAA
ncbi:peptidase S15 [Catenulispora acidiphila DSM 44928]|uniref:Peptidase S15 n=1 Tax=Catenulispora acidiphila (strain DSM 44928 / JCM 14897 / NBRC 102108 / NRRL B-24433 / ID139908) TaxID=479433 RepID=C7Q0G8_CATAD|nr:CocE/NonD family hydrolase [Catenulispora acidiphila]ACU77501.1 peptidase S15 [Catenulispora acidiphila DSM 44928]